ncbi:MAG: response regulator [Enterobacterales bacterium]|nr:response regulator [Enterobacterales bacterium]
MMFNLAKKTTLIVEDFAEFARSVRAMLQTMGATQIDIVYNAEDAIEACKNKKYDIILSDYNLGQKKDGQQLFEELQKYGWLKNNCVFLLLTAENTQAMVMGAVEYQPDDYISKPFNGSLLKNRLQKAISRKDAIQPITLALANKKWQKALDAIDPIIKEYPKYKMSCLKLKYRALKGIKNYNKALELVTELVSIRPIPWAMEAVGEIYYLKNDLLKAIELFRNMTMEFPMALEGYDWLAKIQKQVGQTHEAQETLQQALKKSPKALQRQKNLGALAEINDDLETMTKAYRNAVKYGTNSAFSSPDEYIKLTSAISKQIEKNPEVIPDKLVREAESAFEKLSRSFPETHLNQVRSNVAQAVFYQTCNNESKADIFRKKSTAILDKLDEQMNADISLELSRNLKQLGSDEQAEKLINEAIKQHLDDPEFIKKASEITSNQELLNLCKTTSEHNIKAISYFKSGKFEQAIEWFEKAHKLSPSNINILLNYVQSLLKNAQSKDNEPKSIKLADQLITNMPRLAFTDGRYQRYSELSRLTQLMLQKIIN